MKIWYYNGTYEYTLERFYPLRWVEAQGQSSKARHFHPNAEFRGTYQIKKLECFQIIRVYD